MGIGYRQGRTRPNAIPNRRFEQLKLGYAVAYSTTNQTSNHYDIWLAEDTALRVKRQFSALYGEPHYAIGIGGSGGAIQQYLIGQNVSDLLDGASALYAYPDMLSQTLYALDCELLEYYFDVNAESFFGTLKTELVDDEDYRTRQEARQSLFEYIEGFYNRQRRHSYLGYISPEEYERANALN